jgi:hypothetical protein
LFTFVANLISSTKLSKYFRDLSVVAESNFNYLKIDVALAEKQKEEERKKKEEELAQ